MDFGDVEKIIEKVKKRPIKTLGIFFVFLVLLALIAFVNGFFDKKGKQHAGSSNESHEISVLPHNGVQDQKKNTGAPIIIQHTEGNQSPAVVSESGNVNITYPRQKNMNAEESKKPNE